MRNRVYLKGVDGVIPWNVCVPCPVFPTSSLLFIKEQPDWECRRTVNQIFPLLFTNLCLIIHVTGTNGVNGSWVGVNGLNSGKLVSSPVKNSVTNVETVVFLFKLPRLKCWHVKVTCVYLLLVATQVLRYTVNLIFEVRKSVFVSRKRVA